LGARFGPSENARQPLADIFDDGSDYRVVMDCPGAIKEDLDISPGPIAGTVAVRLKAREEKHSGQALRVERGTPNGGFRFQRVVPVAWDAEVSKAKYSLADGILTLTVPKKSGGAAEETKKK
jgi:HSP20 family molecular chaperone IbpA